MRLLDGSSLKGMSWATFKNLRKPSSALSRDAYGPLSTPSRVAKYQRLPTAKKRSVRNGNAPCSPCLFKLSILCALEEGSCICLYHLRYIIALKDVLLLLMPLQFGTAWVFAQLACVKNEQ